MKDLLIHTSKVKVDTLEPNIKFAGDRPCICFSQNQFISHFGQYVYIFLKEDLFHNFFVRKIKNPGCLELIVKLRHEDQMRYKSNDLDVEYRIYKSIDVNKFCIGILTDFNYMEGRLEKAIQGKVIEEIISLNERY